MDTNYKRTVAGSVGAGLGAIFNGSGRTYYILEHKTDSKYHYAGEAQKIIVDQIELGRDSSCQVRFDESFETVSRKHAAIVKDGENWKLIPLSTTNSTLVNGQPIQSDTILKSGDEIKLSNKGPVMGFIIPQGQQSLVKSIGMTERMNLFRKQALRPYKTAIWILFIVLILAIGGLVAWNLLQAKDFKEQLKDAETQQEVLLDKIAEKDDEIADIQDQVKKGVISASVGMKRIKEMEDEKDKLVEQNSIMQEKIEDLTAKVDEQSSKESAAEEYESAEEPEVVDVPFTDFEDCYSAVYYIKMDNVAIYDKNNAELIRFSTNHKIGGTGFVLSDGRFITANRVVKPWLYYTGVIGKDADGIEWRYEDLQAVEKYWECKVVANFTAYAPNGVNFKFSNNDMRGEQNFETTESLYVIESYRVNRFLQRLYSRKLVDIKIFNKSTRADWASTAKKDQLLLVEGLMFDNAYSISPVTNTEVHILGYPLGTGMKNSESVRPENRLNTINVSDLNDVGVIELSSSRYQEGNDGAPVLVNINGSWAVIGILSHTDGADRDVVVPIYYTR